MVELVTVGSSQAEKAERVAAMHEKLKAAKVAIVTEYRGLTVAQMTRLRREIRQVSGEYQVVKNTLVRRALKDTVYIPLNDLLQGPTGWVLGEDPISLSKVLVKFIDENEKLTIKGGLLDGEFMDPAKVKALARMPSRTELQAKLLALMEVPATQLLRLMQEPASRVVRVLGALCRQKESQS